VIDAGTGGVSFGGTAGVPAYGTLGTLGIRSSVANSGPVVINALLIELGSSGAAGGSVSVASGGHAVILKTDGLVNRGSSSVDAGTATVTLSPYTDGKTIEFGDSDNASVSTGVYYSSDFAGFTAGGFIIGDTGSGTIYVSGVANPKYALTLNAGTAGSHSYNIEFLGSYGSSSQSNKPLTLNAGTLGQGSLLFTSNGSLIRLGDGLFTANAGSTGIGVPALDVSAKGIIFSGSITGNGASGLTLNSGAGSISFGGTVGSLGSLRLENPAGGTVLIRSGSISAGTLEINYAAGGALMDSPGSDMTLRLDRLTGSGGVINANSGAGSVTLAPYTIQGASVEYGDDETSSPQKDIFYSSRWNGFTGSSFIVGDANTGAITVSATGNAAFFGGNGVPYPLVLQNGSAHIIVSGSYSSNVKPLTLAPGGTIEIGTAMINLGAGAFAAQKDVYLTGAAGIACTGGITFSGRIDSGNRHSLYMDAGSTGNVSTGGAAGSAGTLGDITIANAGTVSFGGVIFSSGTFTVNHSGVLDLVDDIIADGGFHQNAAAYPGAYVRIGSLSGGSSSSGEPDAIEITTNSAGSIIFGNDIIIFYSFKLTETAGGKISTKSIYANYFWKPGAAWTLTAQSGTSASFGSVAVDGAIGSVSTFRSLATDRVGSVSLSGKDVTSGNIYTKRDGGAIPVIRGDVSITSSGGTWTLNPATVGGTVLVDSGSASITHAGSLITLNGSGTLNIGDGGSISLQGAVSGGSNTLTLNGAGSIIVGSIAAGALILSDTKNQAGGSASLFGHGGVGTLAFNTNVEINPRLTLAAPVNQGPGRTVTLNSGLFDLAGRYWNAGGGGQSGFHGTLTASSVAGSLISNGDVMIGGGNISSLSIVMTGGGTNSHSTISIHPGGAFQNFVMTGTYGPPDSAAYVEAASDLTLGGSWLIPNWASARPNQPPGLADRQRDEQRFFPGSYTVTFTGHDTVVSGNTFWHGLENQVPGGAILFSNYPDIHTVLPGGTVTLTGGTMSNRITIKPLTGSQSGYTPALTTLPDWAKVVGPAKDFFWVIMNHGKVYASEVDVYNSFAYNVIPINASVVSAEWKSPNWSVNWLPAGMFLYVFTEDSDGNGRLDRLRLQSPGELRWNTGQYPEPWKRLDSSFQLSGYQVDHDRTGTNWGYHIVAAPNDKMFYIYLKEKGEPDTGVIPEDWAFTNREGLLTQDPSDPGQWVPISFSNQKSLIIDTAPPRVYYTLAITGKNQIYLRFSEPVEAGSMSALSGKPFDKPDENYMINSVAPQDLVSINTGAAYGGILDYASTYLLTLDKNLQADDLINGIVCSGTLFKDVRDKPPVPYELPAPAPAYPMDYHVGGSFTSSLSGAFPDVLETATSGSVSQPNFFMMGTMGTRAESDAAKHRASDLLIMVRPENAAAENVSLWPLYARDTAGSQDVRQGVARLYDGSERIRNTDITVEGVTKESVGEISPPPELRFIINSDIEGLWLPAPGNAKPAYLNIIQPGKAVPLRDLGTGPSQISGRSYFFSIKRAGIKEGGMLDFLFSIPKPKHSPDLGPLYGVRFKDNALIGNWYNPANFDSFRVNTRDIVYQRSGATILSNVINPAKGEKTVLHYILTRGGQVTIQVFTLDGNLVQSLYRGSREAGEYDAVWDGKNRGGNVVARGMYFIRIVAPDIDEIRKVMVVR
jgi:hypothetical protein